MFRQRQQFRPFQNRGGRHMPKPINPALFVRKAEINTTENAPVITHAFADFQIAEALQKNITEKGYLQPTPIQDKTIPLILQGKDVIGIANTGTGKTGAFLIPLINKMLHNKTERVLIIAPTRELAVQIEDECRILARGMNIFTALTIGGASMYHQAAQLKRQPHVVIGTPGRLKDFTQQGKLNLGMFTNVVLDEVDRMMDMGFINDIKFLIAKLPIHRQSLFFSATIPHAVIPLMHAFLKNPITVSVKTRDTAQAVEQDVIKIAGRNKIDVLSELLRQEEFHRVLVFGRTKWGINKLAKILTDRGLKVSAIHGNKSQGARQRALDEFKKGYIQILLATDVASRGLDINDVSHVINYDQPASYEDYIHRIGRTGRADKRGVALTFID